MPPVLHFVKAYMLPSGTW